MIKKFLVIASIICVILGGFAIVDYAMDDVNVYESILSIFDGSSSEEYTAGNNMYFNPMTIKGSLKEESYDSGIQSVPLHYGTDIINVPLPEGEFYTTYSDTVYAKDGSYYIVLSKDLKERESTTEIEVKDHKLGRGEPVIVEVRLPFMESVLYIQCYTPKMYGLYNNFDWSSVPYKYGIKQLGQTDDNIAATTGIPKEIIHNKEDMYLSDEMLGIVSSFRDGKEGYSTFNNYNGIDFSYYRGVGFLDNRMRIEYARLTEMGYEPFEYGSYKGVAYIKFKGLTVLGSNITNNSCFIYYVDKQEKEKDVVYL